MHEEGYSLSNPNRQWRRVVKFSSPAWLKDSNQKFPKSLYPKPPSFFLEYRVSSLKAIDFPTIWVQAPPNLLNFVSFPSISGVEAEHLSVQPRELELEIESLTLRLTEEVAGKRRFSGSRRWVTARVLSTGFKEHLSERETGNQETSPMAAENSKQGVLSFFSL